MGGDQNAINDLLPAAIGMIKPFIIAKKNQYLENLEQGEKDIVLSVRSHSDVYMYEIRAINDDGSTGRLIQSGILNELIKQS